jgi:hypothetical protein
VFGWQAEPFGPPGAQITLWRLPGYLGGEAQQPVPRDVVGVMTPIGGDGPAGAVQPHWSADFWVDHADATRGRGGNRRLDRRRWLRASDYVALIDEALAQLETGFPL